MAAASETAGRYMDGVKAMSASSASAGFGTFLTSLFQNPFAALAEGKFLPIIVFAILFGLAARALVDSGRSRASVEAMLQACDGVQHAAFKLIDWVMEYFPFGVFALTFCNFAENGTLLFGPYVRIVACVMVGVAAMILVVYPLAVFLLCRENGLKLYVVDLEKKAFVGEGKNVKTIDIPASVADEVEKCREAIVEAAAGADDDLMMKYLEGEELTEDEVMHGLRQGILCPGMAVGGHQDAVLEIAQGTEAGFRVFIIADGQLLRGLGVEQEAFGILKASGLLKRGDCDVEFFLCQCLLAGLPGARRRIGTAAEQQTGQQGEQQDKANQFFHVLSPLIFGSERRWGDSGRSRWRRKAS